MNRLRLLFLTACLAAPTPLLAITAVVGDSVELKATHHAGVPFHQEAGGTNNFERIPHGTVALVSETARQGNWLMLQLEDRRTGWISKRYVARVVVPAPPSESENLVWDSASLCQMAIGDGARMTQRDPEALRLAAWNIRLCLSETHP